MISVIIPLYNKKKTIAKTIKSILNQSFKDVEIIVVDDGSVDGSVSAISRSCHSELSAAKNLTNTRSFGRRNSLRMTDKKIKIISGLGHFGGNWARNYGAHLAQGKYLFFCDADIILRKDAFQKLLAALSSSPPLAKGGDGGVAYAYSSFQLGWKKMPSRTFDAEALKKCNYISTMSLIRRKDFAGFDESLKKFQDWDLWLTMLEQGKTGIFVPEILFYAQPGKGTSRWLPKFFYKIPWLKEVQKYNEARGVIVKKHGLWR